MKKIEIIERITDANGSVSENILTSWNHKNYFLPEIIDLGSLKIYCQKRIVRKNDKEGKVKNAIADCLMDNMTKDVALDILSNDLQERLYDFIYESEELSIDDGSNVRRNFTYVIRNILKIRDRRICRSLEICMRHFFPRRNRRQSMWQPPLKSMCQVP